jgi:hypothetical protein
MEHTTKLEGRTYEPLLDGAGAFASVELPVGIPPGPGARDPDGPPAVGALVGEEAIGPPAGGVLTENGDGDGDEAVGPPAGGVLTEDGDEAVGTPAGGVLTGEGVDALGPLAGGVVTGDGGEAVGPPAGGVLTEGGDEALGPPAGTEGDGGDDGVETEGDVFLRGDITTSVNF